MAKDPGGPLERLPQGAGPKRASAPPKLPADFFDEIADELEASQWRVIEHAERLAALAELQRAAGNAARRLGRPVTVFDAVEAGRDQSERDRLAEYVRRLRIPFR